MFNSAFMLLAFSATANAAPGEEPTELESPPVYIAARGGIAVPANTNGDVKTAGVAFGVMMDELNSLGLRAIYMQDPPSNPLSDVQTELPTAWGPVVDWQHHFQPESTFSFFTNVSLGFVYGVPCTDTATIGCDDPDLVVDEDSDEAANVILPILEGGVGVRLSRSTANGGQVYISPEMGFVPGAVAPYAAISLGVLLPEK